MRDAALAGVLLAAIAGSDAPAQAAPASAPATAFGGAPQRKASAIRGLTIGPIESALHTGRGYGSEPYARALTEARRMGATWVSLTPFGRVWDLAPTGVDPTFEWPALENRRAILTAARQAHAEGLRVLLVPHLWVETGKWRALIDPGDDASWKRWAEGYSRWVTGWAEIAETARVDLLSVGVELRSWVTTTHAPSFVEVIRAVRDVYSGPLTYSANWDDVAETVILGELDVIGINAFYPLADQPDAPFDTLVTKGRQIASDLAALSVRWNKPVLLTEIGYTTRPNPAVRPWEWPDGMTNVVVDQSAQADAYHALVAPLLEQPSIIGFFVWRLYADPDDMSQEAEWGFSPRGKLAELVLRDAFAARWASDDSTQGLPRPRARSVGDY